MALAFTQEPTSIFAAIQPYCVTMYNSSYGSYTKYRYVLDISINGTLVDRKKLLPNAAGYAIFDISKTVQDYLVTTYIQRDGSGNYTAEISNIAERTSVTGSTSFSRSYDTVAYVLLQAREEYDIAGTVTLSSVQDSVSAFGMPITTIFANGANYLDLSLYGNDDSVDKRFLTNAPEIVYCPADGYGTISFINFYSGTLADNKIVEIGYIGYDDAGGTTGDEYYYNTLGISLAAAGLSEGINASGIISVNRDYIIGHLPFGWQNIEDDNNLSGQFNNSTRIKVKCFSANGVVMESPYLAVTDCSRFPNVRLRFKNAFGVWDYFDFNKVSKTSEVINKKSYKRIVGTFNGTSYTYQTYDREDVQYGFTGKQSIILNTDWLTQDQYTWLAEMIQSNEVAIYESGTWLAANITDSNYEFKTDVVDGIKKQLTIKCEYANELRLAQ